MITDLPKTCEFFSRLEELIPDFNQEIRDLVDNARNELQTVVLQLALLEDLKCL